MASKRTVRISDEILSMTHAFSDDGRKSEVRRLAHGVSDLEQALSQIAECADWCEDCEPTERKLATWTSPGIGGIPMFLCDEHAEETRAARRKAESKGCGRQPETYRHEQETETTIALKALGLWPTGQVSEVPT